MRTTLMDPKYRDLPKFIYGSAFFLLIGTLQGVIQVLPPVRAWLLAIGTPHSDPGRMIDPLAHAHVNLVGGLVLLGMATTYYLLQEISGRPVWSKRLINHTFWWTAIGVSLFYSTLISFGILEGWALLNAPEAFAGIHRIYTPAISIVATVMGMGFWIFFFNVLMTWRSHSRDDGR